MKIEVNISKTHFFILLGAVLLLGIIVVVGAFNTNTPSSFGHSVGEINWNDPIPQSISVNGNVDANGNVEANSFSYGYGTKQPFREVWGRVFGDGSVADAGSGGWSSSLMSSVIGPYYHITFNPCFSARPIVVGLGRATGSGPSSGPGVIDNNPFISNCYADIRFFNVNNAGQSPGVYLSVPAEFGFIVRGKP